MTWDASLNSQEATGYYTLSPLASWIVLLAFEKSIDVLPWEFIPRSLTTQFLSQVLGSESFGFTYFFRCTGHQ